MKEALKLAYDYIDEVDYGPYDSKPVLAAIKAALAQPEQEPVAEARFDGTLHWLEPYGIGLHRFQGLLYTTPPQRTWVGLTDEEVGDLSDFAYANDEEFVRQVEKHLKEKNNG